MQLKQVQEQILSGKLNETFDMLYGNVSGAIARYDEMCKSFGELFGVDRDVELYSAPGRTEVGGNHTDHQLGCVLAGSVNLDVIAVASATDNNIVRIQSKGFKMDTVELDSLFPKAEETEKAASLIRGMCSRLKQLGYRVGGFDAYTTSNVLKGSGLSSSAAFEVLIGNIISYMYNDGAIDPVTIAKCAQYAENEYFGKPSGLMDQMASSVGGFTAIDFGDKENPVIEKVEFDLDKEGYALCIINTHGSHADLTGDYAAITAEMRAVAEHFDQSYLRTVDQDAFYAALPELRKQYGDRAVLRSIHFFEENKRAQQERDALKAGDFIEFLRLVKASGRSSFMKLQNVYSPSNVDEQGLSLALAITAELLDNRGAWRVHGGGFAGTIQAFVPNDMLDQYKSRIEAVFGEGSCYILRIRPVGGVKIC